MEALRLRIKDVEFSRGEILVREGKGFKDRVTMLPAVLAAPLKAHLEQVRALHEQDVVEGYGEVYLPYALDRKYPNAGREWGWQYVFPSKNRSVDPRSGAVRRLTCRTRRSSAPFAKRCVMRESSNPQRRIHFVILLPRTY